MSATSTASKIARAAARERFQHLADDRSEASVAIDPENPPLTDEQLTRMRPAADVHPRLVAASLRRRADRAAPRTPAVDITIRLDAEVADALKSIGEGWQNRANALLRKALGLAT